MKKVREFIDQNRVIIMGALSALFIFIKEFQASGSTDLKALAIGAGIIVTSYIANSLRGKNITIAGIAAAVGFLLESIQRVGHVEWITVLLSTITLILTAAAPAGKSAEYEKSESILQAKAEALSLKQSHK